MLDLQIDIDLMPDWPTGRIKTWFNVPRKA